MKHRIIVIPGLGDTTPLLSQIMKRWKRFGFDPLIHQIGWHDGLDFQYKLTQLLAQIDRDLDEGYIVNLIGCSAGGSAVLNAFAERQNKIHNVVSVCGRLKMGTQKGFRSYKTRTKSSPAFAESVKMCDSRLLQLSKSQLNKIMTVRAGFGDELVPAETAVIAGAINITTPTPEHVLSIYAALTLFSKPLVDFLKHGGGTFRSHADADN